MGFPKDPASKNQPSFRLVGFHNDLTMCGDTFGYLTSVFLGR